MIAKTAATRLITAVSTGPAAAADFADRAVDAMTSFSDFNYFTSLQ
ncbi:MAG: hypothetical protein P4M00_09990 [Azospirillaceae bacterium]|nr:hypothetical protein [Azospirillaceae bacterium]